MLFRVLFLLALIGLSFCIPCSKLAVRGQCRDLGCFDRNGDPSTRLAKTVIPSNENTDLQNAVPTDPNMRVNFEIKGITGTYNGLGQFTTLSLKVEGGIGSKVAVLLEYDFTGAGSIGRTERYIVTVTSDTDPVVVNGNPVSNSGIYQAFTNGMVRASFWIANPTSNNVYLNTNSKLTTITIPYSNAEQAGNDTCKKTCNCVAFRLDDIQDYYMEQTYGQILQLFKSKNNLPLTVGIIGNVFGANGDTNSVLLMRQIVADSAWKVEIANHGFAHEDFSLLTKDDQKTKLTTTNNIINQKLGVTVKTFIPPFNTINADTVAALQELGFSRFSAQLTTDSRPYELEGQTLYHYPAGASTTDFYKTGFVPVSFEKVWAQIQAQLTQDGFSSVMMHPYEFGSPNPADPTGFLDQPNAERLNGLSKLIDQVLAAGLKVVVLSDIVNNLVVPNGATPNLPNGTTPLPTTTNPVTTGPVQTTLPPNTTTHAPNTTTHAPNTTTHAPNTTVPTTQPPITQDPITNKNQKKDNDNKDALVIAGSVIGACVVIGLVLAAVLLILKRKHKKMVFSNNANNT